MSEHAVISAASPEAPPFPEGTVDAGVYASHAEAFERSLVVLAMGEDCRIVEHQGGHHLRVATTAIDAAGHQLACYDRESVGWPPYPKLDTPASRRPMPLSPLLWAFAVAAVFAFQNARPGLTELALLDTRRLFTDGEWWRPVSALWLHADIGHLVSNIGGGLLVFTALIATFGTRAGWLSLAVASVLGNVASAAVNHAQVYRSLGASTAVFAGVGLLAGRAVAVVAHGNGRRGWRAMSTPLFAGCAVLGLFGAGGVEIDVLAHATGFAAGTLLGCITRLRPRESTSETGKDI